MSGVPQNHGAARYHTSPDEPVVYSEQQVLAVFDDAEALAAAISDVAQLGVLDSEIDVACGTERADALRESTGRSVLANLAILIADPLGIRNTEMEAKARYEQAAVAVAAPGGARRAQPGRIAPRARRTSCALGPPIGNSSSVVQAQECRADSVQCSTRRT